MGLAHTRCTVSVKYDGHRSDLMQCMKEQFECFAELDQKPVQLD